MQAAVCVRALLSLGTVADQPGALASTAAVDAL